jgi:hypothetical protein
MSGLPVALREVRRGGLRNGNDILLLSVVYSLSYEEFVLMAKEKGSRGQLVQPERVDKDAPYPMMCKEGKGVRNFACPHYDGCLDKAAKGMWSGFTCRECCSYVQKEEDNQS